MKNRQRVWCLVSVACFACLLLACACGGGGGSYQATTKTGKRVKLTRSQYGAKWPLTVDSCEVECVGKARMLVMHANGKTYAINGSAHDMGGYPFFDEIWRDDPEVRGIKVSSGPLLDAARQLCED